MSPREVRIDALDTRNESGAILILALLFVVGIAFSVIALTSLVGNDLKSSTNLRSVRQISYAAEGATTASIQAVRYSYYAFNGPGSGATNSSGVCLPDGAAFTIPDNASAMSIDDTSVYVYCVGVLNSTTSTRNGVPGESRQVSFFACQLLPNESPSQNETRCLASPTLEAIVLFNDSSSAGVYLCSSLPNNATCGTNMTIKNWDVTSQNQ